MDQQACALSGSLLPQPAKQTIKETSVRLSKPVRAVVVAALGSLVLHFAHGETRALLVGVSVYPHLRGKNLEGPANDLPLMRSALSKLAVRSENIVELSEAAGPTMLPTRANILAGLERVTLASGAGDWVLIYFSGHGAQVPQSPHTQRAHLETDGLDEVFLPRDTTRWVAARGVVDGAIVDDELGAWFDRIRARGAHIWAIFDTCHAGDMTRAGSPPAAAQAVWRLVSPEDLGLKPAVNGRLPARQRAPGRPAGLKPTALSATPVRADAMRTVAFFASHPDEPAAEEVFVNPLDGRQQRFGVFTYHLYNALVNWTGNFETLAAAVARSYRDRPFPTPQFSGDLVQRFPAQQRQGLMTVVK